MSEPNQHITREEFARLADALLLALDEIADKADPESRNNYRDEWNEPTKLARLSRVIDEIKEPDREFFSPL